MASWFRSWHGAPTDNKWLVVARRAGTSPGVVSATFWALLDYASQADDRGSVTGFDVETYAEFSGFNDQDIFAVLQAMAEKGVIADGRIVGPRGWLVGDDNDRPSSEVWRVLRVTVFERDDYTCQYCGRRGVKLECDHVVPVSRGGSNELDNLATACFDCNRAKRAKTPEEWQRNGL